MNSEAVGPTEDLRFIVDLNVGRLARWLRMMGYDTLLFDHGEDYRMIRIALDQARIIITRDTRIMERRVITSGRLRAVLVNGDQPEEQMRQVIERLHLDSDFRPLSLCLECNQPLVERRREEVADRVPPYVFQTQEQFVECPACHRVYWKGTHWQAMTQKLRGFVQGQSGRSAGPGERLSEGA
jgi:uncharacterized protein with PIN domain